MNDLLKVFKSFRFAFEGIKYALGTQHNMRFHFITSIIVLIAALIFQVSKTELLFLFLAITLVIITELLNTAVEKTVDLAMPKTHPLAKIAKDTSAASVLVSAVFAAVVGIVIFFPAVNTWIHQKEERFHQTISVQTALSLTMLVILLTVMLQAKRFHKIGLRPSLGSALSFTLSTYISIISSDKVVHLLAFALSLLVIIVLYDKSRSMASILSGAVVGFVLAVLVYYLVGLGG